jgi:cell division protein FtsL
MFNINLYVIVIFLFILFIIYQIYFYSHIYNNNNNIIKKIESFENTLESIDNSQEYILDDRSLELLLDDYNKLKNNM